MSLLKEVSRTDLLDLWTVGKRPLRGKTLNHTLVHCLLQKDNFAREITDGYYDARPTTTSFGAMTSRWIKDRHYDV